MWPGAGDGEKINYNSIEIDGQLNVSSPHRVVIAHCSLIEVGQEGREGGGTPEDPGGPRWTPGGRRGCALSFDSAKATSQRGDANNSSGRRRGEASGERPIRLTKRALYIHACFLLRA